MADILIFGMKMPTDEPLRIVLNPNGQLFVDHGVTFTEYEAVELPEHGDLIDRDALMADGWRLYKGAIMQDGSYATHEMPLSNPGVIVVVPSNKEEA